MGYTRYWERTKKPITQEFVDEVNHIIEQAEKKGISICGWNGTGKPEVTLEGIYLNGKRPYLDHETMALTNNKGDVGFGFCKTARKPYDYVVRRILTIAKREGIVDKVGSDGTNKMITDEEYLSNCR